MGNRKHLKPFKVWFEDRGYTRYFVTFKKTKFGAWLYFIKEPLFRNCVLMRIEEIKENSYGETY